MKYLIFLALIFASHLLYLLLIKSYAKSVQKKYEPLEREYDLETDEDKRKELLDKLSKMETKAFRGNRVLRTVYMLVPIAITVFVLIIPYTIYLKENIFDAFASYGLNRGIMLFITTILIFAIFITFATIWNVIAIRFLTDVNFCSGIWEDIHSDNVWAKEQKQMQLNNIYPERFPLSRADPLAAFSLFSFLSLQDLDKYYFSKGIHL